MASRLFRDGGGTLWQAWEVIPLEHSDWSEAALRHLPSAMSEGWLCFESDGEKRRIHPIPDGWDGWDDEALSRICGEAAPVPRRAVS